MTSSQWFADAIPINVHIEDGSAPRPVVVIVVADELVIGHDFLGRLNGEADAVAAAVTNAVDRAVVEYARRPDSLVVRHADVARSLASSPQLRGVTVHVDGSPEPLEAAGRGLLESFGGGAVWPPVGRSETWLGWDLSAGSVGALFEAAARFYEAAPWRSVANQQAPRVRCPSGAEWTLLVMGAGGEEFGMSCYTRASDVEDLIATDDPERAFECIRGEMITLSFGPVADLNARARRELAMGKWRIAGPVAYPELTTANTPGGGISPRAADDLTLMLDAVPRFVEAHADTFRAEWDAGASFPAIHWRDERTGVGFRYEGLVEPRSRASSRAGRELPPEIREILDQVERESPEGESPDEFLARANVRLQAHMDAVNARPQAALHGLSPDQVQRLLSADWRSPGAALRLRDDLTPSDVSGSEVARYVRALLTMAVEQGGVARTQAGNLKVAVVRELMAGTEIGDFFSEDARRVTEQEVWPVHEARVLAELAGLLRPARTRWLVTKRGRSLADPAAAGKLFAVLFHTYFREFNLGYGTYRQWPELQHQIAFTLLRLGQVARDWRSPNDLADEVVLPFALERVPVIGKVVDASRILNMHVLRRIRAFGLVDERLVGNACEYRITPLFDRFLEFDV